MGQNQILLIILGMVIVGTTIAVAITLVHDNAITSNRDAVSSDLLNFAAKAVQYYSIPAVNGGGSHTFAGLTADSAGMAKLVSSAYSQNGNGTITIIVAGSATQVTLQGTGNEFLPNGSHPVITCTVTPFSNTMTTLN